MNSGTFQGRVPPGGTGSTNSPPRSPNRPPNNRTLAIAAGVTGVAALAYYMMRQPPRRGTGADSVGSRRPGGDGLKAEDDGNNNKGAGAGSVAHKADKLGQRAL